MRASSAVIFRPAGAADAWGIADLHAESWRRHYRGAYSDAFLVGGVDASRREAWHARLGRPDTSAITTVAELDGKVVGFIHLILDLDPEWGALVDNLHVHYELKRQGLMGIVTTSFLVRMRLATEPPAGEHWLRQSLEL